MARVDSRELSEWMAYEQITGPLDVRWRIDHSAALVASTFARAHSKRRPKLSDYMPRWDQGAPRRPAQTAEQQWQIAKRVFGRMGGTFRNGEGR